MPPASSAFALYLIPNTFPTFTPMEERKKVITPIREMAAGNVHLQESEGDAHRQRVH